MLKLFGEGNPKIASSEMEQDGLQVSTWVALSL